MLRQPYFYILYDIGNTSPSTTTPHHHTASASDCRTSLSMLVVTLLGAYIVPTNNGNVPSSNLMQPMADTSDDLRPINNQNTIDALMICSTLWSEHAIRTVCTGFWPSKCYQSITRFHRSALQNWFPTTYYYNQIHNQNPTHFSEYPLQSSHSPKYQYRQPIKFIYHYSKYPRYFLIFPTKYSTNLRLPLINGCLPHQHPPTFIAFRSLFSLYIPHH